MSSSTLVTTAQNLQPRGRNILLVDDREKRLPATAYPNTFQVITAQLLVADVFILHTASYVAITAIEVKSPSCLFSSYATGRLMDELQNMRTSAARRKVLAVVLRRGIQATS